MDAPEPAAATDGDIVAGHRIEWTPGDVLAGIVWFVGIFFLGQIAVVPFAYAYGTKSNELYASAFVFGAIVEVAIGVVAAAFTFRRYGGSWERLGLGRPTGSMVVWGLAGFAAAFLGSIIYGAFISVFDLHWLQTNCAEQIPREVRNERFLLAMASVVVIAFAPVFEELFFRGFLFPGVARRWGVASGILISGLLFSSAHLSYQSFIPIAFAGIAFAFVYERSKHLGSAMLAHLIFNSVSIAFIAAGTCDAAVGGRTPFSLQFVTAIVPHVGLAP